MRKAGAKDYLKYSKAIIKITNKPVSFEVFADDINNMISQGVKISKWGKNVYVKVPVTNSKGKFMGKVIQTLNQDNSLCRSNSCFQGFHLYICLFKLASYSLGEKL